jgi:hypothetical protein
MSISEEAVVAGAKAMDAYWGGRYAPDEVEELRGEVTAMLEAAAPHLTTEPPTQVLAFINERPGYVQAARQPMGDNDADYHRWQGHMESRRQLATMLGYTVPYELGEKTVRVPE